MQEDRGLFLQEQDNQSRDLEALKVFILIIINKVHRSTIISVSSQNLFDNHVQMQAFWLL